ncbi:MAG: FAD:protein FMN transferase [Pontiella sp.]
MPRKKIIQMIVGLALIVFLGVGGILRSGTIENPAHWGETMGTSYSVRIVGKIKQRELKMLHARIETRLTEINRQVSTWDPKSEIARFNKQESTDPVLCSESFATVVRQALELSRATDGAFDPTLQPLLNLWGFGSEGDVRQVPSPEDISKTRNVTGWKKVGINAASELRKSEPGLSLALGAIAKGYGVDEIGVILNDMGYKNWFAEIGGEVVVRGLNPEGVPWKIGIQHPTTNPMDERLQGILHITHGSVATSGDYRNYIQEDDILYSHILDPRTGYAVLSDTASVTVSAPTCMDADGIATALFVMGDQQGLLWVEQKPGVEAMILIRGKKGEIIEKFSSGFKAATRYTPALNP